MITEEWLCKKLGETFASETGTIFSLLNEEINLISFDKKTNKYQLLRYSEIQKSHVRLPLETREDVFNRLYSCLKRS